MNKRMSIVAITAGAVLMGASSARAQQAPANFVNVSVAGQVTKSNFTNTVTFSDFGETGTVVTNQAVGQGFVFDVRGGRLLWGNFGIGVGLWVGHENGASAATAAIPDPLVAGRFATVTSTANDLKQTTVGVDVQLVWMTTIRKRFGVALAVGPSIVHVSQDVGSITVAPGTQNATPSSSTESATTGKAGNASLDLSYMVNDRYGAGVFMRYAGGEADLPSAPKLKVGGLQLGGGLRVRF
jgi:hypothetical protein